MNSIKNLVVQINDFLVAISFLILIIFCGMMATGGAVGSSLLTFVVGIILLSLTSGLWIVLSSLLENSKKQTELLQKLVDREIWK